MSEEKYQPPTFGVIDYLNKERLYTPEFCKIIDAAKREGYLEALGDVWKIVETANIGDPLTYGKFIEELIELKSCVSSSEASRAGKEGDKC